MSMFEFGFEEEFTDEGRLNDLIAAYEERGESAYFDSDALEDIATHYFEQGRLDQALTVIDQLLTASRFRRTPGCDAACS